MKDIRRLRGDWGGDGREVIRFVYRNMIWYINSKEGTAQHKEDETAKKGNMK